MDGGRRFFASGGGRKRGAEEGGRGGAEGSVGFLGRGVCQGFLVKRCCLIGGMRRLERGKKGNGWPGKEVEWGMEKGRDGVWEVTHLIKARRRKRLVFHVQKPTVPLSANRCC